MFKRVLAFFAPKRRREFEQNMAEELRFHIDHYSDELISRGVPPQEAVRRARIEFGSLNGVQEDCREARGWRFFDELDRQVRHAIALLRQSPSFTLTALATLGICLGANLTIFAVVNAILLRPLPFPQSGHLVTIFNTYPKAGVDRDGSSTANYYERRGAIPAFSGVAIYSSGTALLGEAGATESEQIARVSPDFFSTLGVALPMGRTFTEEETSPNTNRVVILTDALWKRYFAADSRAIGKQLRVDGARYTVVGVLPPDFRFLSSRARLYLPFASSSEDRSSLQRHSGGNSKHMIARLKSGASLEQAQLQIDAQNAALEVNDPAAKMMADAGFRSVVAALHADHVAIVRPVLLWLQAGAFALLLIGAVNLTNLLLLRAGRRLKEVAVRQALGATRMHVVSEVIVETTVLTLAGGLLGLAVGAGGIRLMSGLGIGYLPLGSQIDFDFRLALAAVLGAMILGLAMAAPIAIFNLSGGLTTAIQSESRGGTPSRAAQNLRHGFVVAQIALAMVLLAGTGLLGVSLQRATEVSPGFRADHVLAGRIPVPWNKYSTWPAHLAFNERLLREMKNLPGVSAVGVVNNVPFSGNSGKSAATVQGHIRQPNESPRGHYSYGVDGDYFTAMGFSLKEGRFLNADDSQRSSRVCVVDDEFARYYWPHASALGQRLFEGSETGSDDQAFTVVGVVGAVKQAGLTDLTAQGAVYYPYALRTDDSLYVVMRTALKPESLALAIQRTVRQVDPELPVNDLRSMDTRISDSLVMQRSPALLAAVFSSIAMLLIAVGAYGVLSYAVTQRRREIAVRMALGATPAQIRDQFLSVALRLLGTGIFLGVGGAWLVARALRSLVFQPPAFPVTTVAAAAAVVSVVCLIACLLPSQRAARSSPLKALADQ